MTPHKISFYVYAENEAEATELKGALYRFVSEKYNKGVLVTAKKLTEVLSLHGNNPLITNYLKK